MSRHHSLPVFLLATLACGCTFLGSPKAEPAPVGTATTVDATDSAVEAAAQQAPATGLVDAMQGPSTTEGGGPPRSGTSVWQDAAFRQRFAESYIAETDIEPPPLTEEEFAVLQEAVGLRADNRIDEGIARLRENIGPKTSATFDLTLGKMLLEKERLPEAVAAYEAAVGKHAKFRRAWSDLGLVRYQQGQYASAIDAFRRVIELGGASATLYGYLGFAHANADDFLAAESAFRLAAMLEPARSEWRMGLAHAVLKQQRFAEAATLFGAMIAAQPDRGELWLRQATAFLGMNEHVKAAENLEVLDRMGQATADNLTTLGNIYVNGELYDLAANAYVRALYKDGKDGLENGLRAARALASRGAAAEAVHLLNNIDDKWGKGLGDVQKKEILTLRARTTVPSSEDEAYLLEQVVAIDPLDGDALIRLGRFHEARGELDKAVFRYERAAGITAFEADAKLAHARLLASQSKYAEALPLLRRVQALAPRDNVKQFLEQIERIAQGRS